MARFIESPLSVSTVDFQYMSGSTLTTLTLNASSFNGGGGGATYSAGTGLSLNGTTFNHLNSITSASVGPTSATINSNVFAVPRLSYDATGHITSAGTTTVTVPIGNANNVAVFNATFDSVASPTSSLRYGFELLDGADMASIYNSFNSGKMVGIQGMWSVYNLMFFVTACFPYVGGYTLTARCECGFSVASTAGFWDDTFGMIHTTMSSTTTSFPNTMSFFYYSVSAANGPN